MWTDHGPKYYYYKHKTYRRNHLKNCETWGKNYFSSDQN